MEIQKFSKLFCSLKQFFLISEHFLEFSDRGNFEMNFLNSLKSSESAAFTVSLPPPPSSSFHFMLRSLESCFRSSSSLPVSASLGCSPSLSRHPPFCISSPSLHSFPSLHPPPSPPPPRSLSLYPPPQSCAVGSSE